MTKRTIFYMKGKKIVSPIYLNTRTHSAALLLCEKLLFVEKKI